MTNNTQTTAATPRETAFADAAEALQTIATGSMALLSAVYNLIDEASKDAANRPWTAGRPMTRRPQRQRLTRPRLTLHPVPRLTPPRLHQR